MRAIGRRRTPKKAPVKDVDEGVYSGLIGTTLRNPGLVFSTLTDTW